MKHRIFCFGIFIGIGSQFHRDPTVSPSDNGANLGLVGSLQDEDSSVLPQIGRQITKCVGGSWIRGSCEGFSLLGCCRRTISTTGRRNRRVRKTFLQRHNILGFRCLDRILVVRTLKGGVPMAIFIPVSRHGGITTTLSSRRDCQATDLHCTTPILCTVAGWSSVEFVSGSTSFVLPGIAVPRRNQSIWFAVVVIVVATVRLGDGFVFVSQQSDWFFCRLGNRGIADAFFVLAILGGHFIAPWIEIMKLAIVAPVVVGSPSAKGLRSTRFSVTSVRQRRIEFGIGHSFALEIRIHLERVLIVL